MRTLFTSTKKPVYLKVADKPISNKEHHIERLNAEEIEDKFCFMYNENITMDDNLAQHFEQKKEPLITDKITSKIQYRIENPLNDSLVVAFIDKLAGYGVFTQQPIDAGTIVMLYAGQYEYENKADYRLNSSLVFHPDFEKRHKQTRMNEYQWTVSEKYGINAGLIGGIARFVQHMPEDITTELSVIQGGTDLEALRTLWTIYSQDDCPFTHPADIALLKEQLVDHLKLSNPETNETKEILRRQPIASANLIAQMATYQGVSFTYFIATRSIGVNEQLGVSYGKGDYWENQGVKPGFFNKKSGYVQVVYPMPDLENDTKMGNIL